MIPPVPPLKNKSFLQVRSHDICYFARSKEANVSCGRQPIGALTVPSWHWPALMKTMSVLRLELRLCLCVGDGKLILWSIVWVLKRQFVRRLYGGRQTTVAATHRPRYYPTAIRRPRRFPRFKSVSASTASKMPQLLFSLHRLSQSPVSVFFNRPYTWAYLDFSVGGRLIKPLCFVTGGTLWVEWNS